MNGDIRQNLSRRSMLLRAAGCAAGVAGFLTTGLERAHADKLAQSAVDYQQTAHEGQKCSACSRFEQPHGCKVVAGEINPEGWCKLFLKA